MEPASLVIAPIGELVSLDPQRITADNPCGRLAQAAVVVTDGAFAWVGQAADLPDFYRDAPRMDASDLCIVPGLVDSHTHLVFAGRRSDEFALKVKGVPYMEIAARGGGILATVRATRRASVDELVTLALPRLKVSLGFGVTTMEVKSGYGLDTDTELKMLEVIGLLNDMQPLELVPTFMGAHEFPEEFRDNRDGYVDLVCGEMIPAVAAQGIARFVDVFCEQGVFTPKQTARILAAGMAHGLKPRIHADEFAESGGAQVAARFHALSADHLMAVGAQGIRALADAGVVATLLPGTSLFLGKKRYADARALIQAGVTVAVATDFNPGSCMSQNLPLMGHLACTQMGMSPEEAMAAITCNAAKSLGLSSVGRIVPGMRADLAGLAIPAMDDFFYHFGVNHTAFVMKSGCLVWEAC